MRWGMGVVAGLFALAVGIVPASGGEVIAPLAVGQAMFWKGGYVASGMVKDSSMCNNDCPTWKLQVAPGGGRLRVALDTPSREDTFGIDLIDPSGAVASSAATNNQFDAETFAGKPAAGTWTVRVVPQQVTDAAFRLRAKLEGALPALPAGHVALLPNLKAVPPMELGFVAPANPLNGVYPPDTVNPPLDVLGIHPISCAPDEMAPVELGGAGAHRCLRLTSGPINVGAGAFDMHFDLLGDMAAGKANASATMANIVQGPMFQAVHYSDHTISLRPAGTYSFHTTHGHFHTDQILSYDLLAVTNPAMGALKAEGGGTKSGFCPADQLFGSWRTFSQMPQGTFGEGDSATGNCFSPSQGVLGLTSGWGDVYRWQRPGQYVEFDGGDGLYVVRTTVDKSNHVLEENENDNSAYAYIRVTGEHVDLLERGQGTDPWDAHKIVFKGAGPASVDPIAEEAAFGAPTVLGSTVTRPAPAPAAAPSAIATLPATGATEQWSWWLGLCALAFGIVMRRGAAATRRKASSAIASTAGAPGH
jgi:hypothetical protein